MVKIIRRCRQLFRALFAKMEPKDHAVVDRYLNEIEKLLFYRMQPAVQKHCVNVAETVSVIAGARPDLDHSLLMKAALLHDIGKSGLKISLTDRIWYVLVRKFSSGLAQKLARPGKSPLMSRLRNAFYIHLNHGKIGASMAQNAGLSEELVFFVRNHHNTNLISGSEELEILIRADELN